MGLNVKLSPKTSGKSLCHIVWYFADTQQNTKTTFPETQAGCGERGIRTPGTSRFNGFQDRRNRPLCHLSGRKSRIILHAQALAESFSSEFTQNP